MGPWRCLILLCILSHAASIDPEKDDKDGDVEDKVKEESDIYNNDQDEVDGGVLVDGDMILSREQWLAISERKGIMEPAKLWPIAGHHPMVYYQFSTDDVDKNVIREAMNHFEQHTCILFKETKKRNIPRLVFIKDRTCWSAVGMVNSTSGQNISISHDCPTMGTVAHELGHAIGFFHEHNRSDRDEYVIINRENILPGKYLKILDMGDTLNLNVPYDYTSIMHYLPQAFTANGRTTITPKNPLDLTLLGARVELSHRDKHLANLMYGCIVLNIKNCGFQRDPCVNEGYIGKDCKCVCRHGTTGEFCETITGDYYGLYRKQISMKVKDHTVIMSINFPQNYPNLDYVTLIEAPKCYRPRLNFTSFSLGPYMRICGSRYCCFVDAVEIRTETMNDGEVFCEYDIERFTIFTARHQELVLYFRSRSHKMFKGFMAEISVTRIPHCH